MDIKDVIEGNRVKYVGNNGLIPYGAIGTIIESYTNSPYVSWDEHYSCTYYHEDYVNVYAVCYYDLILLETETSDTIVDSLKLSISVEDKNEIAKDILKIVLQDLNNVITKAIKDLDTNNSEEESNFFDNYDISEEKMYKLMDEVLKDVVKEQLVGIFKEK